MSNLLDRLNFFADKSVGEFSRRYGVLACENAAPER